MNNEWKLVKIKDMDVVLKSSVVLSRRKSMGGGGIPVIGGAVGAKFFHRIANCYGETITISKSGGNAGFVNYFDKPIFVTKDCIKIQNENKIFYERVNLKYLYYYLKAIERDIYKFQYGCLVQHIKVSDIKNLVIPLPPFAEQEKIVVELDSLGTEQERNKVIINLVKLKNIGKSHETK
jgi:restriction endonuclease S subunit